MKHIVIACLLLLAGCAAKAPIPLPALDDIEVVISHDALQVTEFEQFRLNGNRLFAECGVLNGGRFSPETQNMYRLSEDDAQRIRTALTAAWDSAPLTTAKLSPPGSGGGMFDPGSFGLTIRNSSGETRVNSSLDEIANSVGGVEERLRIFLVALRRTATEKGFGLCGNTVFFGIEGGKQGEQ
jgi:hypothetical protein